MLMLLLLGVIRPLCLVKSRAQDVAANVCELSVLPHACSVSLTLVVHCHWKREHIFCPFFPCFIHRGIFWKGETLFGKGILITLRFGLVKTSFIRKSDLVNLRLRDEVAWRNANNAFIFKQSRCSLCSNSGRLIEKAEVRREWLKNMESSLVPTSGY